MGSHYFGYPFFLLGLHIFGRITEQKGYPLFVCAFCVEHRTVKEKIGRIFVPVLPALAAKLPVHPKKDVPAEQAS